MSPPPLSIPMDEKYIASLSEEEKKKLAEKLDAELASIERFEKSLLGRPAAGGSTCGAALTDADGLPNADPPAEDGSTSTSTASSSEDGSSSTSTATTADSTIFDLPLSESSMSASPSDYPLDQKDLAPLSDEEMKKMVERAKPDPDPEPAEGLRTRVHRDEDERAYLTRDHMQEKSPTYDPHPVLLVGKQAIFTLWSCAQQAYYMHMYKDIGRKCYGHRAEWNWDGCRETVLESIVPVLATMDSLLNDPASISRGNVTMRAAALGIATLALHNFERNWSFTSRLNAGQTITPAMLEILNVLKRIHDHWKPLDGYLSTTMVYSGKDEEEAVSSTLRAIGDLRAWLDLKISEYVQLTVAESLLTKAQPAQDRSTSAANQAGFVPEVPPDGTERSSLAEDDDGDARIMNPKVPDDVVRSNEEWNRHFEQLVQWRAEHGTFEVSEYANPSLYHWIREQEQHFQQLESVGFFGWSPEDESQETQAQKRKLDAASDERATRAGTDGVDGN